MIKIHQAETTADFEIIADLATVIWTEHYTPIIGSQQVTYMLQKFQSANAIQEQVLQETGYFLITYNDTVAGYFSFKKENESLFLSKFYVLKELRGLGIGKKALNFIRSEATAMDCTTISLTVNKNNSIAIKAYEKMGFKNLGAVEQPIGNGFVMDDYVMKLQLVDQET